MIKELHFPICIFANISWLHESSNQFCPLAKKKLFNITSTSSLNEHQTDLLMAHGHATSHKCGNQTKLTKFMVFGIEFK